MTLLKIYSEKDVTGFNMMIAIFNILLIFISIVFSVFLKQFFKFKHWALLDNICLLVMAITCFVGMKLNLSDYDILTNFAHQFLLITIFTSTPNSQLKEFN